jgi:hypothetical protein
VGTAPQILYSGLLEPLARYGYGILAAAYSTDPNHRQLAEQVAHTLRQAQQQLDLEHLPTFGLGHSLGCKLHILSCVQDPWIRRSRRGNILMAYSNASFQDALPGGKQLLSQLNTLAVTANPLIQRAENWLEFDPSPAQTQHLIDTQYEVAPHLLIQFQQDSIDDLDQLYHQLSRKFSTAVQLQKLPGDHVTPISQAYPFTAQDHFTLLDALGQLAHQTLTANCRTLVNAIRVWLEKSRFSV